MGLLTNPNTQPERFSKFLLKYYVLLSCTSYIVGVVWFISLSSDIFNSETYISENALLPAMVEREFNMERESLNYLENFREEMDRYQNEMPTAWLQGQFRQLGLEVYLHNYSLKYPLAQHAKYDGKNIYAILRAPRAASTEALVLSAPFRSPIAVHPDTSPGIALMFALAKFFRQRSFWAKDIIFLITEHEQLGAKAWLEAYHGVRTHTEDSGILPSRSGSIQAAINLEIHDKLLSWVDIKIEGLTGQLPNLDLFNLVIRLCLRENVRVTFKNRGKSGKQDVMQNWWHSFQTTMSMVKSQATGVPTGNHGLFLRYNIEALTIEGHSKSGKKGISIRDIGRVVEGTFRSLNNLLESLHQSFFFYLLPSVDRYVSIGLYMPPLGLILLPTILNVIKILIESQGESSEEPTRKTKSFKLPAFYMVTSHLIGFGLFSAQSTFDSIGTSLNLSSENALLYGNLAIFVICLNAPIILQRLLGKYDDSSWEILKMFTMLESAVLLATAALVNYSLALLLAVVTVPFTITTSPSISRWKTWFSSVFLLLVSPFGLVAVSIFYDTLVTFPEVGLANLLYRCLTATKRALLYAVTDGYIYNNWMFQVANVFYLPIWIQLWCTQHAKTKVKQE